MNQESVKKTKILVPANKGSIQVSVLARSGLAVGATLQLDINDRPIWDLNNRYTVYHMATGARLDPTFDTLTIDKAVAALEKLLTLADWTTNPPVPYTIDQTRLELSHAVRTALEPFKV